MKLLQDRQNIVIRGPSSELIRSLYQDISKNMKKSAPHHSESDLTRTKCREGCASTCEIFTKHGLHREKYIILLRVIPTMAFNSSHLTFCLAYLLAFYLTFYLTFYLAFYLYLACLLTFYLAYLLTFYLADLLTFYLGYLLAFCLSYLLTFYLAYLLTFYLAYLLTFYLAFSLAFYIIWLCFWLLRSGWGPARPMARRISPVEVRRGPQCSDSRRFGEARCDRELAVEARRGPLRSRAGSGGPARPTAIKSWQMRSGEARCDQELADEVRRGGRRKEEGGRRKEEAGNWHKM